MSEWQICDLPQEIASDVRVDPASGCWIYGGNLNGGGYGWVNKTFVHRLAYERLVGPIPPSLTIDHVKARGCTSKACCWPGHLEPVTRAENSRRNAQRERAGTSVNDTPRANAAGLAFTSEDARKEWRRILNKVESGEPVGITRYGKPVAVVVSADWYGTMGAYVAATTFTKEAADFYASQKDGREHAPAENTKENET